MTRRAPVLAAMVAATVLAAAVDITPLPARVLAQAQELVFRAQTDLVTVDVSVWSRGRPVRGLSAADFVVHDAGVKQTLHSASTEDVPIDVTLFIDTSSSMADLQLALQRDAATILGMLRPIDRLRVLTLGYDVHDWLSWQSPARERTFTMPPVGRVSNIYDAVWMAMIRRPDPGRRHLVVALTDGDDWASVMPSANLVEAASRSESVLHIVKLRSSSGGSRRPWQWMAIRPDVNGQANLQEAALRTGGRMHDAATVGRQVVSAFERAFDDFRQGYVLSYAYQGPAVEGWHDIAVAVEKSDDYSVRARRGYFAKP